MITGEKIPEIKEKVERVVKDIYISRLHEGKPVYLRTSGSSMYPFVKGKDIIKIVTLKEEDIKIGDIVTIANEKEDKIQFCVHRIIKIFKDDDKKMYLAKGDGYDRGPDKPIKFEHIVGKITQIERNGLIIDLEKPIWRYFNSCIAHFSFKFPKILRLIAPCISLLIEWRRFPLKVMKRLAKKNSIHNTEELLLISARKNLDKNLKKKAIGLIKKGVCWEDFSNLVIQNGIAILAYNTLKRIIAHEYIPQVTFDKIKSNYLFILSRTIFQYKETEELLKLFSENNIPSVPLKGLTLSKRLYGDIAVRGINCDIDLLIEEKNKPLAAALLKKSGYNLNEKPSGDIDKLWHYLYRKPDGTILELHWDINPIIPNKAVIKEFWKGTRLLEDKSVYYYEFKEEELLLQLSLHFIASARLMQLRYVCDINELLTKYRDILDWEDIIEKAKRWRLSGSLYTTLGFARMLFHSYVPDNVFAKLKPALPKRFLIKLLTNKNTVLRKDSRERYFINKFLKYIILDILEARSIKDLIAIIFPPKEILGNKTYLQRITRGMIKLIRGLTQ